MKTKLVTLLCLFAMTGTTPVFAAEKDSASVITDIIIIRPACFVATIIGSAFFVVSLPIAAMSHSVKSTGHILVANPAHATFTRPLGDFTDMED
jgi:hypothetical protein